MLGEKCDATNQATGMGWMSMGWGLGSIMGPALGGFLSSPCDQWRHFPLCRHGQLFEAKYVSLESYLLPSCRSAGDSVLAVIRSGGCLAAFLPASET